MAGQSGMRRRSLRASTRETRFGMCRQGGSGSDCYGRAEAGDRTDGERPSQSRQLGGHTFRPAPRRLTTLTTARPRPTHPTRCGQACAALPGSDVPASGLGTAPPWRAQPTGSGRCKEARPVASGSKTRGNLHPRRALSRIRHLQCLDSATCCWNKVALPPSRSCACSISRHACRRLPARSPCCLKTGQTHAAIVTYDVADTDRGNRYRQFCNWLLCQIHSNAAAARRA